MKNPDERSVGFPNVVKRGSGGAKYENFNKKDASLYV